MNAREAADLSPEEQDAGVALPKPKPSLWHDHHFVFLRQEKVATAWWGERVTAWAFYDVFFCDGCLAYQKVKVNA